MTVGIMDTWIRGGFIPLSNAELHARAARRAPETISIAEYKEETPIRRNSPAPGVEACRQETSMLTPTIPSRPRYSPFALVPEARAHLIVAERSDALEDQPIPAIDPAPLEFWAVSGDSRAPVGDSVLNGVHTSHFRSTSHLLSRLSYRLAIETIGFHLYAIGTESFIWDVAKLAKQFGMNSDEYHLTHRGSEKRRVYCIHCKTMTDDVTSNIAVCAGCGANLFVRDHFSKRLAAFMGVQVDAEVAGEVPAIEEVYP
jgi:dimethylamine monooxygenase subunit C